MTMNDVELIRREESVAHLGGGDAAASKLVLVLEELLDADALLVHAIFDLDETGARARERGTRCRQEGESRDAGFRSILEHGGRTEPSAVLPLDREVNRGPGKTVGGRRERSAGPHARVAASRTMLRRGDDRTHDPTRAPRRERARQSLAGWCAKITPASELLPKAECSIAKCQRTPLRLFCRVRRFRDDLEGTRRRTPTVGADGHSRVRAPWCPERASVGGEPAWAGCEARPSNCRMNQTKRECPERRGAVLAQPTLCREQACVDDEKERQISDLSERGWTTVSFRGVLNPRGARKTTTSVEEP